MEKQAADRPDDIETRLSLGAIYMQAGRWNDGAREFETAVRMAPDHPVANYNAGQIAFTRRDYDVARVRFERAIQLRPDLAEAHATLGVILEMRGETAAAMDRYRTVLTLRPGHVLAATHLARVLMGGGSWNEAIAMLDHTLQERPREPALLDALAKARAGADR